MENTDNTLQEMKQQMQSLQSRLNGCTIVQEKMFQRAYRSGISSLHRMILGPLVGGIAGLFFSISFLHFGFSLVFFIVTESFFLVGIGHSLYLNSLLPNMEQEVSSAIEKLSKFKKIYVNWLKYGILGLLFWVFWMMTELIANETIPDNAKLPFSVGAIFGLLIGLVLGFKIRRKTILATEEQIALLQER